MTKKWLLVGAVLVLWVAKLTYDQQYYADEITSLQSQITKANQATDNLNDQLIALQRHQIQVTTNSQPVVNVANSHTTPDINPLVLVKQQLDLIQFSLQQQQSSYALEHLQVLTQNLVHYDIAQALKQNLLESLITDQQHIKQHYQQQELQNKQISSQLQKINQYLNALMTKANARDESTIQEKTWFSLQHTDQAKTAMMSRSIIIKEMQLRLLLAQQLFYHGQYQAYQVNIDDMLVLTKQSPLVNDQELQRMLQQARNMTVLELPKLQTMALVK